MNTDSRDWDASTYDRVAAPMTRRGVAILDRLTLRGDERVLDAGCGTGRVTAALLERLSRGSVVALDGSPSMIDQARAVLGGDARVEFVVADLRQPLPVRPVDAIISTSTFHWVPNHAALYANLAAVLEPGGQLVVDSGGAGNIASVREAMRAVGESWTPWTFPTPEEERSHLEAAGFDVEAIWLEPDPVDLEPETLETYLLTVILGAHLERLPEPERDPFVKAVAERMPRHIDYVRLKFVARRR